MAEFYRSHRRPAGAGLWANLGVLAGGVVLTAAVVSAAVVLANRGSSPPPDAKDRSGEPNGEPRAAAPVQAGAVVSISAESLHTAFLTNEPAAKAKYADREVRVLGCVGGVREASGKGLWVVELTLPGIAPMHVADCCFAPDPKSGVLQLKPYTFLTVSGRCRGPKNGVVLLEECRIAPAPGADPGEGVLRIDAKKLWEAYRTDAAAAHARYCGRAVEVSGCPIPFAGTTLLGLPSAHLFDEQLLRAEAAEQVKIPCYFANPRQLPPADSEPKTLTIRARVGGDGLLPVLQECSLSK